MAKFWNAIKGFSPLKPVISVGNFFVKIFLWLFNKLVQGLKRLAPIGRFLLATAKFLRLDRLLFGFGRLLLFFARITGISRILNWSDLVLIARPYWTGKTAPKAFVLLAASLFCMVANAKAAYYFGHQLKVLSDIVNRTTDEHAFFLAVASLAGIGAIWTVVGAGYGYFRSLLGLDWRMANSQMYMQQYVRNEAYLRLTIDNADQRISQDPDVFANTTVWLFMVVVETVVNLYTFVPVLWESSLLLFGVCVGCAAASYVAVLWLGRALPDLTERQLDTEATLRTNLQDGPRYASSIALQRIEKLFLGQSVTRLNNVRSVLSRVMRVNLYVSIWNTFTGKAVDNAALIGIGWLVMHGRATMGDIAQAAQAFGNVYAGFTVFTREYGAYSTLKAELARLGPFVKALDAIGENRMPQGQWIEHKEVADSPISFNNVTIFSSYLDAKPVVADMTLTFDTDTLVTGRDGHGKTDLAKAIGLGVAAGAGTITRPAREKIMFVPQSLYLPVCSLRVYLTDMQDAAGDPSSDERLLNALDLVGLHGLPEQTKSGDISGLDVAQDWKNKLTGPQQIQLCLARAILFRPTVLVLDQATDGLEAAIEEDVYKILKALGVRLITLSNSSRLAKSHKRVVELKEDGSYSQTNAPDYTGPSWRPLQMPRRPRGDQASS